MRVHSLDHLVLTVADISATLVFYQDVLGIEAIRFRVADGTERFALSFGVQKINLHQSGSEFDPKAAAPTRGSADLCFLSEESLDTWLAYLSAKSVSIEEGPVDRTGAQGAIRSLYIRDPDGNLIEISNTL